MMALTKIFALAFLLCPLGAWAADCAADADEVSLIQVKKDTTLSNDADLAEQKVEQPLIGAPAPTTRDKAWIKNYLNVDIDAQHVKWTDYLGEGVGLPPPIGNADLKSISPMVCTLPVSAFCPTCTWSGEKCVHSPTNAGVPTSLAKAGSALPGAVCNIVAPAAATTAANCANCKTLGTCGPNGVFTTSTSLSFVTVQSLQNGGSGVCTCDAGANTATLNNAAITAGVKCTVPAVVTVTNGIGWASNLVEGSLIDPGAIATPSCAATYTANAGLCGQDGNFAAAATCTN